MYHVDVKHIQGLSAMQKDAEAKSLQLRLTTSEQHAELIKMYSSPLISQSPLVVNSRTVTKIASTHHMPVSPPPFPKLVLDAPKEPPPSPTPAAMVDGDDSQVHTIHVHVCTPHTCTHALTHTQR